MVQEDLDQTGSPESFRLQQALQIVSPGVFARVLLPRWIYRHAPIPAVRNIRVAFEELEVCRRTSDTYQMLTRP